MRLREKEGTQEKLFESVNSMNLTQTKGSRNGGGECDSQGAGQHHCIPLILLPILRYGNQCPT